MTSQNRFRVGQKVALVPGMQEEFPELIHQQIQGRIGRIDAIKSLMGVQICYIHFAEVNILQKIPAALVVPVTKDISYPNRPTAEN